MKIVFYLLNSAEQSQQWQCLAEACHQAYRDGVRVQILLPDEETLQELDNYLWTFEGDSFLAHDVYHPGTQAPVVLCDLLVPNLYPTVINLKPEAVNFNHMGIETLIEIVSQEPEQLNASRERYRAYQKMGIKPETRKWGE